MTNIVIRKGEPADTKLILDFIRELAVYEKLEHMVVATVQDLEKHLFGDSPKAKVLLAEEDGKPLGFALYFYNFSTFLGRPGIYLEDLFVRPEARGVGVGKLLLQKLAQIAVEENCGRFEWWVLDWNEPAIN
ncbi:MAG TPA: GNAT family N-acetyltransferase, partial [Alphaproteobacteria bacterium]